VIALLATLLLAPIYDVQRVLRPRTAPRLRSREAKSWGTPRKGPGSGMGASVRHLFPDDSRQLIAMDSISGRRGRLRALGYAEARFRLRQRRAHLPWHARWGFSMGVGISNGRRIAGDAKTGGGEDHSFVYENGSVRDIGTLGGNETMTLAVSPAATSR